MTRFEPQNPNFARDPEGRAGRTLSVGEVKVFSIANGVWISAATGMATVRNLAAASP